MEEKLKFQITMPTCVVITVPAEHMPKGWQVWSGTTQEIADKASNRLGLPVAVIREEVAHSQQKNVARHVDEPT